MRDAVLALESQKTRLGGGSSTSEKFMAKYADYYRTLVRLEVELGKTESAFETLEKFRARSLLEMIAEKRVDFYQTQGNE